VSVATAAPTYPAHEPNVTRHQSRPFTRTASLGYQVNHLARLLAQALHQKIAPLGVVPGQFAQLLALFEEDGLTQRDLCDRVRIEQPTMANTLHRMERDGLIRRKPDAVDGRRARVMLTARARKLEDALTASAQEVNAMATRGLTHQDVSAFMETVAKMINNLESAGQHATKPSSVH
jgi:DNA-binding MarR family transcriptional regulator